MSKVRLYRLEKFKLELHYPEGPNDPGKVVISAKGENIEHLANFERDLKDFTKPSVGWCLKTTINWGSMKIITAKASHICEIAGILKFRKLCSHTMLESMIARGTEIEDSERQQVAAAVLELEAQPEAIAKSTLGLLSHGAFRLKASSIARQILQERDILNTLTCETQNPSGP